MMLNINIWKMNPLPGLNTMRQLEVKAKKNSSVIFIFDGASVAQCAQGLKFQNSLASKDPSMVTCQRDILVVFLDIYAHIFNP